MSLSLIRLGEQYCPNCVFLLFCIFIERSSFLYIWLRKAWKHEFISISIFSIFLLNSDKSGFG